MAWSNRRRCLTRILIANRGEIACRVIRTARHMGIAHRCGLFRCGCGGAACPTRLTRLCISVRLRRGTLTWWSDKIVEACKRTGAQAVHPGYGFLSENAGFAAALADNGIAFIGPPAAAIEAMGSKSGAKAIMEKAGRAAGSRLSRRADQDPGASWPTEAGSDRLSGPDQGIRRRRREGYAPGRKRPERLRRGAGFLQARGGSASFGDDKVSGRTIS